MVEKETYTLDGRQQVTIVTVVGGKVVDGPHPDNDWSPYHVTTHVTSDVIYHVNY